MKIGIIAGTGDEGIGLALRFAYAGDEIVIGSRSADKAQAAAASILQKLPSAKISGTDNESACRDTDVVINTLPYQAQRETLSALRDAIGTGLLISTVVPVIFNKQGITVLPVEEGSAAVQAQKILPDARVVAAFHTLGAKHLADYEHAMESDVLVAGDRKEDKAIVIELAQKIKGIRGVDCGPLSNSNLVENMTVLLLNVNRVNKVTSSVRIVGIN